ncbi:hypothetical protein BV898_14615 [Hypsibius exemplaris]|uniref:Uncharacterized protein n=1 Tax=Hypsibius exemplaris TaxID=2072580 RepID=A0A9X6RJN1_HYPEX|nr:hypothetical protein BV898_14615 [Hypsibius exemplaris]
MKNRNLFKECLGVVQTEMLNRELSFEIDVQKLARAIINEMDFVKSVGVPTVKLEREQNFPLNGPSTTGGTFHPFSASVVAISVKREPLSDVKGSSVDRFEETAGVKMENIPTSSFDARSSVHGRKIRRPGTVSENTGCQERAC